MSEEQDITAPLEAETLQAGWAARTSAQPRSYALIAFGAKTDLGQVRENNEDKFDFIEPDEPSVLATKGRVFAVADGMGGHSAGQVAAELALNVFIRSYYVDTSPSVEPGLERAVREISHDPTVGMRLSRKEYERRIAERDREWLTHTPADSGDALEHEYRRRRKD